MTVDHSKTPDNICANLRRFQFPDIAVVRAVWCKGAGKLEEEKILDPATPLSTLAILMPELLHTFGWRPSIPEDVCGLSIVELYDSTDKKIGYCDTDGRVYNQSGDTALVVAWLAATDMGREQVFQRLDHRQVAQELERVIRCFSFAGADDRLIKDYFHNIWLKRVKALLPERRSVLDSERTSPSEFVCRFFGGHVRAAGLLWRVATRVINGEAHPGFISP